MKHPPNSLSGHRPRLLLLVSVPIVVTAALLIATGTVGLGSVLVAAVCVAAMALMMVAMDRIEHH